MFKSVNQKILGGIFLINELSRMSQIFIHIFNSSTPHVTCVTWLKWGIFNYIE